MILVSLPPRARAAECKELTRPKAVDLEEGKGSSTGEAETTATTGPAVEITKATAGGQTEKHFYGTMTLDPVRATLDFATVVDEVV